MNGFKSIQEENIRGFDPPVNKPTVLKLNGTKYYDDGGDDHFTGKPKFKIWIKVVELSN